MTWNYTKTWFFLAWGAILIGLAVGEVGGKIMGALFILPFAVFADLRHRGDSNMDGDLSSTPPESDSVAPMVDR